MKSPFNTTLDRSFVIGIVLLLTTSVISFIVIRRANDRSYWINHTYEVKSKLELVISYMKDAETGTRGFLLNGDSLYLEPYYNAYKKTINIFNEVRTLTSDNPQQQATLPQLGQAINNVFTVLQASIAAKQHTGAIPNTYLLRGKQYMDGSRNIISVMQNREDRLLQIRTNQWKQLSLTTPFLIVFILVLAVVLAYYFVNKLSKSYSYSEQLQQELQNKNAQIAQRIAIVQDITNHIAAGEYTLRVEAKEKDVLGTLSENLNRMAASLEYSFNTLKELNQRKDDFIGMAAHELKTPVTGVKAYLQIISRASLESEEGKRVYPFITKANQQINRIINIISDLLDVTKINSQHLSLQLTKVPVRELIIDAAQEIFIQARTHDLSMEGDPDVIVKADKFRMEQVFINILSNAAKYSPAGTKIIVTVAKEPPFARIAVTDFGIGILPEKVPFIFERYYRVDDTLPATSGLGLGLYITKNIIERHGGTIKVNSTPGVGSTFTFTLPLASY